LKILGSSNLCKTPLSPSEHIFGTTVETLLPQAEGLLEFYSLRFIHLSPLTLADSGCHATLLPFDV